MYQEKKKATKEKNKESYNTKWMHTITNMTSKKIQILLIPMADTWFCTHRGKMVFHFKHRCNFCVCTRWKRKINFGPPCWCRCSEDDNELDLEDMGVSKAPQIQAALRAPVRFFVFLQLFLKFLLKLSYVVLSRIKWELLQQ